MKAFLLSVFVLFFAFNMSFAQTSAVIHKEAEPVKKEDIAPKHDMIVVNPLKFFQLYNLTYYHSFAHYFAFGAGVQYHGVPQTDAIGMNGEIRFYPMQRSLAGFYVAPNISYNLFSRTYSDAIGKTSSNAKTIALSVGGLVGGQWFSGDYLAFGVGIGVDHWLLRRQGETQTMQVTLPAWRFDIGYAW